MVIIVSSFYRKINVIYVTSYYIANPLSLESLAVIKSVSLLVSLVVMIKSYDLYHQLLYHKVNVISDTSCYFKFKVACVTRS